VAVERVPPILADDVRMRFEDRDDLLQRWHGLAVEHTTASLVIAAACERIGFVEGDDRAVYGSTLSRDRVDPGEIDYFEPTRR